MIFTRVGLGGPRSAYATFQPKAEAGVVVIIGGGMSGLSGLSGVVLMDEEIEEG